ncbi:MULTISPECIES: CU044_5270 family protein [unclassified Crossiella]|uniref:CU044_5270 family protein n=1 Tax=unclassified Crossiella TaxID=2620835 RepID=UPI001FFF24F2|nr:MULTISPECIES: CU044_5270 family protein [unclassified Crossiella]MCK2238723.1 CU044_5270 family protein [Crossiella sp. S99.2]MCK2251707.1 CU044_5270 family protein [Crossiella sp. S99.1]
MSLDQERAELTRLLPPPGDPELSEQRHAELRAEFLRRVHSPAPRLRWARVRWPVLAIPFVVAGLVAAVVLVAPAIRDAPPVGSNSQLARPPVRNAAELLSKAIEAVRARPLVVRPDQYLYVDSFNQWRGRLVGEDGNVQELPGPEFNRLEKWYPGATSVRGASRDDGGELREGQSWDESDRNIPPVSTLPTDPDKLLAQFYGEVQPDQQPRDWRVFKRIHELLMMGNVPPDVLVGLYQAAARIPGVHLVGETMDVKRRAAVAVGFVVGDVRVDWLFDRTTFEYLGQHSVALKADQYHQEGQSFGPVLIMRRAVVDRPGQTA